MLQETMRNHRPAPIVACCVATLWGCATKPGAPVGGGSGGAPVPSEGIGGRSMTGGATPTGDASSSGGSWVSGGASGNGGSASMSGGASATGGDASPDGGQAGQGSGSGGSRSSGGAPEEGGSAPGSGGARGTANGGGTSTGGAAGPTGGAPHAGQGGLGQGGTPGSGGSTGAAGMIGGAAGGASGATGACLGPGGQPRYSGNPFVKRFVADPAAHVFNGRVYVYDTDDQSNDGTYWNSTVWHGYSSANLVDWTDEGTVLNVKSFAWAVGWSAWAPDVVSKNGKYYFFAPIDDVHIGVAMGNTPTGPFSDAIGSALIDKTRDANAGDEPIDPAVLIDDDGQAYLYFGSRVPKAVKLTADLLHLDGPILNLSVSGNNYGEAPWMGKHNGIYYFSYSTGWPGQIAYGTASSPMGPFTFQGLVLDFVGIQTNHESIIENFKGKSYIFYHNAKLPGGGEFRRSIDVDELHYDGKGAIVEVVQTTQGVACVP